MLKPRGTLSGDLVRRCMDYGHRCCRGYVDGDKPQSLHYATRGIESNPQEQARSKAAECGFALCYGLDPLTAVDWSDEVGPDWDVIVRGIKVDVKRTELTESHRRLMWSNTKAGIFHAKAFDALALVKTEKADYLVAGWISKERFAHEHCVARPDYLDKIDEGTLFVMQDTLHHVETLGAAPPTYHNDHRCHCGAYGTRSNGIGPIEQMIWFCQQHDLGMQ